MNITVEQPYGKSDLNRSHKLLDSLDKAAQDKVKFFIKNFLLTETIPDFRGIEIETHNRCNNDCPFCPVNRNNDTRKPKIMDEQLFYSIINQLRIMDYRGTISLYCNNEPLLDGRILKFVEYARKNLPYAHHLMYTNGILLDLKKFLVLINNLDTLILDNYDDDFKLIPSIEQTLKEFESLSPAAYESSNCQVKLSMRKKNQKLSIRAGSAPNRINEENKFRPMSPCTLPFVQMIVRPDGTIAKCCSDPLNPIILGDLNKQTFREIWRGKPYQELRKEMYFNGRQGIKGCEFCNAFGLLGFLPQDVFSNEFKRMAKALSIQKKLNRVYVFDTFALSRDIFNQLKFYGVELDGFINVRDAPQESNFVTFEQAINERAFILFMGSYYDDAVFDYLHNAGYQYGKDYMIYHQKD